MTAVVVNSSTEGERFLLEVGELRPTWKWRVRTDIVELAREGDGISPGDNYPVMEIENPSGDLSRSLFIRLSEYLPIYFRSMYVCDFWIDQTTLPVIEFLDHFFAEKALAVTHWRDGTALGGGPSMGDEWRLRASNGERTEVRSWLGTYDDSID
ncbi:hypothetical protein EON81_12165 [bacterium]|nr:MAG: hypothetical protein EON81_12165 [bacterium]